MYQQITLVGNLGSEVELRYTPAGVPVASFSLAINKVLPAKDGAEKQTKTMWFRVTAWRNQAETVSQYLHKGSKVLVVGELEEPKVFTGRDGANRASLDVTAQTIKFLGGAGAPNEQQEPAHSAAPAQGGEEIPF